MKKQFFIGGVERSGTTILMRCLGMHKDISDFPRETLFFAYPKGLILVIKGYISETEFKYNMLNHFYEYVQGFVDKKSLSDLLDRCFNNKKEDILKKSNLFITELFDIYIKKINKKYWIEKSPRNIVYADYLFKIFPNMKFIHIFRDPLDVCSSHINRKARNIDEFIEYYNITMKRAYEAYNNLNKNNYLVVSFEDLIADIDNKTSLILDFLGVEKYTKYLDDIKNRMNPKRSNIGRHKSMFNEKQIQKITENCSDMYELWSSLKK